MRFCSPLPPSPRKRPGFAVAARVLSFAMPAGPADAEIDNPPITLKATSPERAKERNFGVILVLQRSKTVMAPRPECEGRTGTLSLGA